MDVMEFLRAFVLEEFGKDVNESDKISVFVDDSLDKVEMLMDLEEKFGVSIPDQDVLGVVTVGDLARVISTNLSRARG